MRALELNGKKFGFLTVLDKSVKTKSGSIVWNCICDCGKHVSINGSKLKRGATKSCGCKKEEMISISRTIHGKYGSAEYNTWSGIKKRCLNKKDKGYPRYGGRGIKICDRWMVFENFLNDMGYRPEGCTIDRINNDGHYEPGNCKWSTAKEQSVNRRSNIKLTINNETKVVTDWAIENGIKPSLAISRIHRGWSPLKAVTIPVRGKHISSGAPT